MGRADDDRGRGDHRERARAPRGAPRRVGSGGGTRASSAATPAPDEQRDPEDQRRRCTRVECDCPSLVTPASENATAITTAAGNPAATSVASASAHARESTIQATTTSTATITPPRENVSAIATIQP